MSNEIVNHTSVILHNVEELFRCGKFHDAIELLSMALAQQNNYCFRLRRAECYQQIQSYDNVIVDCSAVINSTPTPPSTVLAEAYFKRSQAFQQLEEFQSALNDIERALLYTPSDSPLRLRLFNTRSILRQLLQPKPKSGDDPVEFYTSLYRLHVKNSLPGQIVFDEYYTVEVRLTNEFGLFKSEEFRDCVPIPLKCSLFRVEPPFPLDLIIDPTSRLELNEKGRGTFRFQLRPTTTNCTSQQVMIELAALGEISKFIVPLVFELNCVNTTNNNKQNLLITNNGESDLNLTMRITGNNHPPFTAYRLQKIGTKNLLIKELGDQIATKVWDCAIFMSRYFEQVVVKEPNFFVGKRVLELGSGTGFLGLACWALGSKSVVLTDLASVLPNLLQTVEFCRRLSNESVSGELEVRELCWGQTPLNDFIGQFDIVVASDVIYDLDYFPALLTTMSELATTPKVEIYLGYRSRGLQEYQEKEIFSKISEVFDIEDLDCSHIDCFRNARIIRLTKKRLK